MESPVTLRLDPETRRRVAAAARRKGITKSEVIRRALKAWAEASDSADSPYALLADLIGVVRGGNPTRSEKTGKKFRKLLATKRRRS